MKELFDSKFWNTYTPLLGVLTIGFTIVSAPLYLSKQCPKDITEYSLCQLGYFFGKYGYGKYDSYFMHDLFYSAILSMAVVFVWYKLRKTKQKKRLPH